MAAIAFVAATLVAAAGRSLAARGQAAGVPDAAQKAVAPAAQPQASTGKAHLEIPDTEASTCLTCHEDVGKGTVVHAPVEGGMCTACHEFSGEGDGTKVALVGGVAADTVAGLCTTCHDDVATDLAAAVQHVPVQTGECLTCHDPHAAGQAGLLKSPQRELCGTCHDDVAEELKKASVHAPASAQCSACHKPHGSASSKLLRLAPNGLCQACHALPPVAPGAEPPASVTIAGGVRVERGALPLSKQVDLDPQGRGHPMSNHPTSGPSDPLQPDRPFSCVSCHAPHGSDTRMLIAFVLKPGEGVCQKCHEM